jgi:hypothetical protein
VADLVRYEEALEAAHRAVSLSGTLAQVAQKTLADIARRIKQ